MSEKTPPDALSYKPSTFYFRTELRAARTKEELLETSLHVVEELERLKAWTREQGLIPPRWFTTPLERQARPAGSVFLYESKSPVSGMAEPRE